ncbi:MAG: DoxX family protein [Dysgonamonadaceae bacterium]|nr:DoxX family protein [Dysgonamonadaceae bacterium]MDD3356960.1 DoxX family protein [Dysgonamonadaceae bacterium]MDD3727667.1 DoxX family protein [Dysgonamonadaceae bacterium]HUI32506.1 DoxX family protein [Dysgonamonadaceae bacterium]
MNLINRYSKPQLFSLVALRVVIGWYFLYEGLAKLFSPNWTSYGYLMDSAGIFAPFFKELGLSGTMIQIADNINIYGLIAIGLCLILGSFTKIASLLALAFLSMYYLSHPPLIGAQYILRPEGSYLWVDKNAVIFFAIVVLLFFPTSRLIGLDRYIYKLKERN